MSEERVAVRVVASGRVQGVGFRWHLQREAAGAGLSGWCRNRYDGSVEVVLCGRPHAVDRVVAWCRQGPPHADVRDVTIERGVELVDGDFHVRG